MEQSPEKMNVYTYVQENDSEFQYGQVLEHGPQGVEKALKNVHIKLLADRTGSGENTKKKYSEVSNEIQEYIEADVRAAKDYIRKNNSGKIGRTMRKLRGLVAQSSEYPEISENWANKAATDIVVAEYIKMRNMKSVESPETGVQEAISKVREMHQVGRVRFKDEVSENYDNRGINESVNSGGTRHQMDEKKEPEEPDLDDIITEVDEEFPNNVDEMKSNSRGWYENIKKKMKRSISDESIQSDTGWQENIDDSIIDSVCDNIINNLIFGKRKKIVREIAKVVDEESEDCENATEAIREVDMNMKDMDRVARNIDNSNNQIRMEVRGDVNGVKISGNEANLSAGLLAATIGSINGSISTDASIGLGRIRNYIENAI